MCGINGFNWNGKNLIKEMNKALKHRGPDDQGTFSDNQMSFSQVRLSIIDLSPAGHQPMFYNKQAGASSESHNPKNMAFAKTGIVFNGEIYNYQELKEILEKKGYFFSTKSDTEVILASYLEWGSECVNKFNGMWAFCIYDKKKNILFLSRDRLGVKPMFYYYDGKEFAFSSEIKGILKAKKMSKADINPDAVRFYFSLGFIPGPLSIYNHVFKLEARQNMIFDLRKKSLKKSCYYELPDYNPKNNRQELVKTGKELLFDSTRLRLISDVPVGAFLSGGLDSSSVVGAMSKYVNLKNLHTFSIGFEGKNDETRYVNIVKDYYKTKHHHHYFKEEDFEKMISQYAYMYDEPFGDYSGFPTAKVSEIARKKVTVALSGDGGDEIFAGYNTHLMGKRMELLRKFPQILRLMGSKIPAKKDLNKMASLYLLKEAMLLSTLGKEHFYAKSLEKESYKPKVFQQWSVKNMKYSLKKGNNDLAEALRIYDLLFNSLQDNFLVKVDRASMFYALEVRSPFLDYRFVELAQNIPTKWKISSRKTKKIMRDIIKDLVPKEICNRGKQGFDPPLEKWIMKDKYQKKIRKSVELIKELAPDAYEFYIQKVFKENNKLYTNYKIRLFLFANWWEMWIGKARQVQK